MQHKHHHYTLLILILLEILLTAYLFIESSSSGLCLGGADCASVQNSEYGSLFGIKLSFFGLAMFILLLGLFLATERYRWIYLLFFTGAVLGFVFAIYFISIQLFILKKFCSSCILIDSIAIVIFIVTLYWSKPFRQAMHKVI